MALTKIETTDLTSTLANTISTAASEAAAAVAAAGPKIANVQIANSSWSALDDTAIDLAGGYVLINGSGFQSGLVVLVDNATPSATTRMSNNVIRVTMGAKSAGSYNIQIFNPDGGTAILINGLTFSGSPTWVTTSPLANGAVDVAYSVALNATGATTYSLQAGSSLPSGFTLAANGLLSGTVSGISQNTQYSFTVVATDNENQDSPRTFSVTIVVATQNLYTWGLNQYGELGHNDITNRSSPTLVGTDATWNYLSSSVNIGMGIKNDGTLWAWGRNNYGRLGIGDTINRSSPIQVGSLTNWSKIQAGQYHIMAIKTDGTLWAWGTGSQRGLDSITYQTSSPTQVGSDTNWSVVTSSSSTTHIIKTNGTLWACGQNGFGALGIGIDNNSLQYSSPIQVGSDTNWSKVSSHGYATIAIKTNNTMHGWGYNFWGELGINTNYKVFGPNQISGTSWSDVSMGEYMTLALKTNGTLWSMGKNIDGQLGLNASGNYAARSSPVQIGTATDWIKINAGQDSAFAIKSNKSLWAWGKNDQGQLGLNSLVNRSSPTQVGSSTDWNIVSTYTGTTLAATN